jgi:hypothetical protein
MYGPLHPRHGRLPVLPVSGFRGGDRVPTLARFQGMLAINHLRYMLLGGDNLGIGDDIVRRLVLLNGTLVDPSPYGGVPHLSQYDLGGWSGANGP